ncbi:MAG: biotin--[acetyl-CoA-carboxylase] ligase [Magnetococcales bacterium]|nr:biotin--[acetyl-CoA-carboxylase] ligase [Magnetococcales bacterium]
MSRCEELTRASMIPRLTNGMFGPEGYRFEEVVDSTNRMAMTLAQEGAPHGTVVVADGQTGGRGRLGRSWASPPGVNLYFSMILKPELPLERVAMLTLLTGVALAECVTAAGLDGARLKWPNDLLHGGRKLGGILAEMTARGERARYVIVGVGLNVNGRATGFPADVAQRAVTMAEVLGRDSNRGEVLADFLHRFTGWYRCFLEEGFASVRAEWLGYARLTGGERVRVTTESGEVTGEALDLDERGCLMVRRGDGGILRVMTGEINFER